MLRFAILKFVPVSSFISCYDGETPPDTSEIDPEKLGTDHYKGKVFTQEQLNAFVAKDRRKREEEVARLTAEANELKKSNNLTKEEKARLDAHVESLNATLKTKDQLTQEALTKAEKIRKEREDSLTGEVEAWRGRFHSTLKENALTQAAAEAGAFSITQVVQLLDRRTVIEEVLDDEQKGTGHFAVLIEDSVTDKEGKVQKIKLAPKDALKRMKDKPEEFGNLFKENLTGGVGLNNQGSKPNLDINNMTQEQYRKNRDQFVGPKAK